MITYFEFINKCLVELNYKKVQAFKELNKNDHEKIKDILNIINSEICSFDNWGFLLRKTEVFIPKHTGEIPNPVRGRIQSLMIDGIKYDYYSDFEKYLQNKAPSNTYSAFGDRLLLPLFRKDVAGEIIYYTYDFAQDEDGFGKSRMEEAGDMSVVPEQFIEPLLVYGTCMRIKANPSHNKFGYWMSMYKQALANLRSKVGTDANEIATIRIARG